MITPKTKLYSSIDIIRLRDEMELSELREINRKCMEKYGYVDFRNIFKTMGYVYAFKRWLGNGISTSMFYKEN